MKIMNAVTDARCVLAHAAVHSEMIHNFIQSVNICGGDKASCQFMI